MTHRTDVARGREIIARWCILAEQRLDHLTELYETGRWRRYHGELAFLENLREAKSAVETWRDLSLREESRDASSGDICWLGQGRAMPPRREPAPRFSPQPLRFTVEPPPAPPVAAPALQPSPVETAAIHAAGVDAPVINVSSFGPDLRLRLDQQGFKWNEILPSLPEAAADQAGPGGQKEPDCLAARAVTDQTRGAGRGSADVALNPSAPEPLLGLVSDYFPEPTLDLAVMQLRYPLLRNTM